MNRLTIPLATAVASAWLLSSASAEAQQMTHWIEKVSIHGYLNQAYAVSEEHQIFGIPTDGTTDYRDLALQFRYDEDRQNVFVVQVRQQRRGRSTRPHDPVELDWAFYQRNVSDRVSLKAGRIPLPLGIYNEAGGAASTSPFFRPADELYDRRYTSKTIEGVLGSLSLGGANGWTFDVDAYFGQWMVNRWSDDERSDATNAFGAQVWTNSPLPGIRIGAGAYRCTVEPSPETTADYLMLHGSAEADLDRWTFAAEYITGDLDSFGRYQAFYAQAGLQLSERVSIHARGAVARMKLPVNGHLLRPTISDDVGLALNYAMHPALLFRVESHTNEGLLREDVPQSFYDAPSKTRYWIASVVATF